MGRDAVERCGPIRYRVAGKPVEYRTGWYRVVPGGTGRTGMQRTLDPRVRGSSPWRRTRKHVSDLRVLELRGRAVVVSRPCWAGNGQGWRTCVVSGNPLVRFPGGGRSSSVAGFAPRLAP